MKLQNKSYIFLLIFFFGSCVAKKSTIEYKERIVRDTVKIETVKTIIKPIKEFITIENPCDSLGILKEFDKEIKTELSSVRVFNNKGAIKAEINIDSIKQVLHKEFKINNKRIIETKEVVIVKYKYPLWLVLVSIISILMVVVLIRR